MKLLGLGANILRLRAAGQNRSASTCCPEKLKEPLPCCPKKRFWTFKRILSFSTLTFGAGVYTGIYVSQNYEVPRVDDPQKLMERMNEKVKELMDKTKQKSLPEQLADDIKKEAKKILKD